MKKVVLLASIIPLAPDMTVTKAMVNINGGHSAIMGTYRHSMREAVESLFTNSNWIDFEAYDKN